VSAPVNRQFTLDSRPHGDPRPEHFKLVETPVPAPTSGEMLLKTQWLSLDPYMRGRMSDAKSYAKPVEVGGVMVGQIGKIKGCRVIGIAGGADKTRFLTEDLGFDDGLDHRAPDFAAQLKAACSKGIDIYFENVGGTVWNAVLPLLNDFARVPVCGLTANYNLTAAPDGPDRSISLMSTILAKRLRLQGFIYWDFNQQRDDFLTEAGAWLKEGRIKYREDIVEGLENAPEAFMGLLKGRNFGKLLVKVE
jgi:NADPH-dependent curcumin reductase